MPSFTIRDASRADVAALARIERDSFVSDRLSLTSLRRLVRAGSAACRLAEAEGAALGYYILLFRADSPAARLYSIAVDPAARGGGVARALLKDAETVVAARGRSALRLEVRVDNPAAIALYESEGFGTFGRRSGYYADGTDALRYRKHIRTSGAQKRRPPRGKPANAGPASGRSARSVSAAIRA